MTQLEYKEYQEAVAAFFKAEGIICLSTSATEGESIEPYFTWSNCDVCKRREGGMREDMHGFNPTTQEIHGPYQVCEDCVYYVEYGRLDDRTMLEMEVQK